MPAHHSPPALKQAGPTDTHTGTNAGNTQVPTETDTLGLLVDKE